MGGEPGSKRDHRQSFTLTRWSKNHKVKPNLVSLPKKIGSKFVNKVLCVAATAA